MSNINLTYKKTIRNVVMFVDFAIVLFVVLVVLGYSENIIHPNVLITAALAAMALAQLGFSTIVHHHRITFDKLLARTTALVFTFGLCLFGFMALLKWTVDLIVTGKMVGVITVIVYVLILSTRVIEHNLLKVVRRKGRNYRTIIFVGKGDRLEEIVKDIELNATQGLRFLGYYSPTEVSSLSNQMEYLGDYAALDKVLSADKRFSDELYCALPYEENELSKKLIRHCMQHVTHFYYVPLFISEFGGYLKPSMIGEQVVFANFSEPLLDQNNRILKRTFDIVCSGLALVCLLPFFPIIALIIKCSSPGPVFFKQARTGLGGKDFMMLKFRSMHVNKDADKVQATKNDPRKFPFGNFMRRTSIDELPQLWNIFIGDMSIVGPRPHMRSHTEEYRHLIDDYMLRHYIRPGLTGWAQTTGFRGETQELWQMEGRVKRDVWYIQNWSFWLDIRIILRTVKQVVWKDNQAY